MSFAFTFDSNQFVDVAPVYPDCHDFVMAQRSEVYEDLLRALQVMNIISDQTPVPNAFFAMWLLENRQLSLSANIKVSIFIARFLLTFKRSLSPQNRSHFVRIVEVLQQTFENKVDLYWISKGFYNCALEITQDLPQLKDLTYKLLEKENITLHRYSSRLV